jgi:hypothetical protein
LEGLALRFCTPRQVADGALHGFGEMAEWAAKVVLCAAGIANVLG